MSEAPPRYLPKLLGFAVLYALLGKAVLLFFSTNGIVSVVWPPSGLALAALLIGGQRYFPGVFLGAFLVNIMTGLAPGASVAIATGSTLEALLGAWLLTRRGKLDLDLRSLRSYLHLVGWGGFLASSVAALSGATTLLVSGFLNVGTYWQSLLTWWMSDTLGIVLMTPLILVWRRLPRGDWAPQRIVELTLLSAVTVMAGQIVFLGWFSAAFGKIALGYWMFLFKTWTAVRMGIHGVVLLVVISAIQGLWGAALGVGFFANDIAKTGLFNYWYYTLVLSFVGMALATYLSERQQLEASLKDSELRYRTVADFTSDLEYWIMPDGALRYVSPSCKQITGYTADELYADPELLTRIIHPDDQHLWAEHTHHVTAQGVPKAIDFRIRTKDGADLWISHLCRPVVDDGGQALGLRGSNREISEQKKAEAELQRSHADLRRFSEITAHHLQEPARRMASYAERLGKQLAGKLDDPEARLSLDFISQQARYQQNMLRDVERYLAADQPRGEIALSDARQTVAALLARAQDRISAAGAGITVGELPPAWIDAPRLVDLFEIVLGNALQHGGAESRRRRDGTPESNAAAPGAVPLHITLDGERIGTLVRYRVSDNGPGIEEQYRERVFRAFERLESGGAGTGIGLAIVRRIAESCGGRAYIDVAQGGGCCVVFELSAKETT
jgi:PAS domain S-box-containing protein